MGLLGKTHHFFSKTSSYRGSGVEKQPFRGEAPAPLGDVGGNDHRFWWEVLFQLKLKPTKSVSNVFGRVLRKHVYAYMRIIWEMFFCFKNMEFMELICICTVCYVYAYVYRIYIMHHTSIYIYVNIYTCILFGQLNIYIYMCRISILEILCFLTLAPSQAGSQHQLQARCEKSQPVKPPDEVVLGMF